MNVNKYEEIMGDFFRNNNMYNQINLTNKCHNML